MMRTLYSGLIRRSFSTTARRFGASGSVGSSQNVRVSKKMGSIGGGILGFIIGGSAAGALSYYYLLEEYQNASTRLLSAVDQLQTSTDQVREYAKKIEEVDSELAELKTSVASKEKVEKARRELRKLYDVANIEHLELKTHVWAIEQKVHSLLK
ncbi:hypothetical protein K493DRAFT_280183 [Basidiobolus meristosporus CBS 931.73]|uniref:Uncharacterized protein n=1 Tax=Basidiobolus meristosporus CBS 931.73 TaxID=1314790 RepID=A0A1Y1YLG4_9FUNG|nr:hypothetical protein K493DRAFT_280183 [Basidiobolus meristosporus CBS 931.73]|eukprot:ORX98832.1 hypothetical protein K493DRAFT_280183 [Basidiobolus meristosporus CBS 931.73]